MAVWRRDLPGRAEQLPITQQVIRLLFTEPSKLLGKAYATKVVESQPPYAKFGPCK